ncbi:hypothetical protein MEL_069 [Melbournevirus]|uniref:hypothetical protein n=1 Tax=Melbournevirus TaxID=1560514 RepID=UPI00051F543B|nr:hypothetical protein MEL_069 [Melbournevirus]
MTLLRADEGRTFLHAFGNEFQGQIRPCLCYSRKTRVSLPSQQCNQFFGSFRSFPLAVSQE